MRVLTRWARASLLLATLVATHRAGAQTYTAVLNGANESPPNASPGTGSALVVIDAIAHTMTISATFTGLSGTTTASHIHCCTATPLTGTAGVATQTPTFTNLPIGVTSGSFTQTLNLLDASSYNAAYITANGGTTASAEAALLAGIAAGRSYFNIHTTVVPGGEIRGFLVTTPEPGMWALLATGLVGIGVVARRRRA